MYFVLFLENNHLHYLFCSLFDNILSAIYACLFGIYIYKTDFLFYFLRESIKTSKETFFFPIAKDENIVEIFFSYTNYVTDGSTIEVYLVPGAYN